MKAYRPPQSFQLYNAAYVSYSEGRNKDGDYYWLLYCEATARDYDENGMPIWNMGKNKTKRQEEQSNVFRKLGMISREIANLRQLVYWSEFYTTKGILNQAIFCLQEEYKTQQQLMKTISTRIPNGNV